LTVNVGWYFSTYTFQDTPAAWSRSKMTGRSGQPAAGTRSTSGNAFPETANSPFAMLPPGTELNQRSKSTPWSASWVSKGTSVGR